MMTETNVSAAKPAWWFWLVCAVGVVWNGFGAFDFAMSALRGDAYYRASGMTEAMITFFHSYPAWMWIVWFVGTWGALAGTVLMILRSRWAFPVYVASFAAFLLSLVYAYTQPGHEVATKGMAPMHITIFAGCIFFIWFARFAIKKGLLR
jgi:hypothetical protein